MFVSWFCIMAKGSKRRDAERVCSWGAVSGMKVLGQGQELLVHQ